jgi:hypothetical protein
VQVHPDRIDVDLNPMRLAKHLVAGAGVRFPNAPPPLPADSDEEQVTTLTIGTQLKRTGKEMKFVVEGERESAIADASLVRLLARAHLSALPKDGSAPLTSLHGPFGDAHIKPSLEKLISNSVCNCNARKCRISEAHVRAGRQG